MSFTKFLKMLEAARILLFDEVTGFYHPLGSSVLLYKGGSVETISTSLELVIDIVIDGEAVIVNKQSFQLDDFDVYRNDEKLELMFG